MLHNWFKPRGLIIKVAVSLRCNPVINQVKKAVNQLKSVSGKHFAKPCSVRNSKSLLSVVLYAWFTNQTHVEYYSKEAFHFRQCHFALPFP
jgi:hypothetical protein